MCKHTDRVSVGAEGGEKKKGPEQRRRQRDAARKPTHVCSADHSCLRKPLNLWV